MPEVRPDPLAHSAPESGGKGQPYADHIKRVRCGVSERAAAMLRFAADLPPGLLDTLDAAASFHDFGKLDEDVQGAMARGRGAKLRWDHIDAGVAHLAAAGNWMAAWLVRAHHAPGLPAHAEHFDPDGLGRRLRGCRHDDDDPQRHEEQMGRTDACLSGYLAAHEAAVGPIDVGPMRACHGLTMRLALSCLVDADHADAARFDSGHEPPAAAQPRWKERLAQLDAYVRSLGESPNDPRTGHRAEFYRACREARIDSPMAACEGPVGLGKTTAVTAHLLRCASDENLRHLIIVAPFTNIITQTVRVLRKALVLPGEKATDVIVEHHHRADFDDRSDRDMAVLWRAPVIVTTAVQLFETLASNNPSQLRKLHELPGSALFLDEAHAALPTHLWPQNWRWLRELAGSWGCRIVFASGSLTRFWKHEKIVPDPIELPELLPPALGQSVIRAERRRVLYQRSGRNSSVQELVHRIAQAPGPRLVILNTVQSAAVVARAMRDASNDVLHLSTALCPRDRDTILNRVQRRLKDSEDKDWSLVATSCVEAGVDLSFRTAFRERFGTASLIQVGGRVNRHGEFDSVGGGIVFDFLIDAVDGITSHPSASFSAEVLKRQFREGAFDDEEMTPAQLVTTAMIEELRDRGGLGHDALAKAERERDYPSAVEEGRVIQTDTRIVVVDPRLRQLLENRRPISFRTLLRGSVQIWARRLSLLRLEPLPGRRELYVWPYAYDPDFLGYMTGALQLRQFWEEGGAIV